MSTIEELVRQEIAQILVRGSKEIVPSGPYNTGPGGSVFGSMSGVNREFISTVIQPQGLASRLPWYPSMYANPQFGYITGFNGATGTRAQGVCDDARIPGGVVTCIQTAMFGRYRLDTKPLEINRVGLLNNRADPVDFTLMNGPLFNAALGPGGAFGSGNYASNMFNPKMEMASRMGDVAREFDEIINNQLWYGDPSDPDWNTADGGENAFPGLSILVGTTKIDARTGTPCDALKSDIKNFNNWDVTIDGGHRLFNALYYIVQTRDFIAKRTNMGDVVWNWAMREAAWNEIVKLWPCVFATSGCLIGPDNTAQATVSLDNQARLQQDMYDNKYLPIGGRRIPVIIDDTLAEESLGNGSMASDIWYLPRTVKGGRPVLFMEYLDYNQGAVPAAEQAGMGPIFKTDTGKFLWWSKPNNNVCIQLGVKTEPRVVLLTPHLAGRLDSVAYNPLQHGPDAYRDQPYYNLTGESVRAAEPDLYSDYNTSGPGYN